MGKRLIRIYDKDIPALANTLIGLEINIILRNKSTCHGLLISADKEGTELKDMRNHKHYFKFSDMMEIVYDKVAAY
ncbi:MAG TPA: hypothetical protein VNW99_01280 [Cytophagaceae bacterium]|jgi:hypothetical protein|nr:hypothetical protein [Cytophagaceae bacterium]